jgi:hypothetical protein
MAERVGTSKGLLKWCGMALVIAAPLMVLATLLHPSRETAATIIASEGRLVAAHAVWTVSWFLVLLGLPGLYAAQRGEMRRLGLAGFLAAMLGTYLIALTGFFGFLAPVLARESPAALDATSAYTPLLVPNALAFLGFTVGWFLFGIAMARTTTMPRLAGILIAVGAPMHLLGFGIAQFVSTAAWAITVLGAVSLGAGLAWAGLRLWRSPADIVAI